MLSLLPFLAARPALADIRYYSLSLNGHRTGYMSSEERTDVYGGRPALRTQVHMVNVGNYGGTTQKSTIDGITWSTLDNRPLRETMTAQMLGQSVKVDAVYGPKSVEIDFDMAGTKSHKSVALPDGPVYEDEGLVVRDKLKPGATLAFWNKGATSDAFSKSVLKCVGPVELDVDGKKVAAILTEDTSDGTTSKLYTSPDGVLLRMDDPSGQVVQSTTKALALATPEAPTADTDLLALSSLKIEGLPDDPSDLRELKLRVVGEDLSDIPSDETQTVTKEGDAWIVDLHPSLLQIASGVPVAGTGKGKEAWLQGAHYLPVDDPKIQAAVKAYRDPQAQFPDVVQGVRAFVAKRMKYKIEMGPWRDAADILRKPNGKCTEYAVLTTTLLRAAGVPARLVTGLVPGGDGALYYHAWAEAWDGATWFGVDSTAEDDAFPAYYIKLSQGNPDDIKAIYPPDPKAVKFTVLSSQKWSKRD